MKIDYNIQKYPTKIEKNKQQPLTVPNFSGRIPMIEKFPTKADEVSLCKAEKFLDFLATNKAWGAVLIDLFSMVLPRTILDFTRSTDAGLETGRRESMGSINHSSIGLYGTLAGLALSLGINKAFNGARADKIFADDLTIDKYAKIWDETAKAGNPSQDKMPEFVNKVIKSYDSKNDDASKLIIDKFTEIINSDEKPTKETKKLLRNELIKYYSHENDLKLKLDNKELNYTVDNVIENVINIGKNLKQQAVKEKPFEFFKLVKGMNIKRSIIGIGIGTIVGCLTQPINMYLTKKKTGSNAFVGGGEEDKSGKFKAEKVVASTAFAGGVLATIGKFKDWDVLKKLKFQGINPTISQFKFIYGMTIVSRLLSARNENELRESLIKDSLGFANWLIFGDLIATGFAKLLDKGLVKDGKVLSRSEILFSNIDRVAKNAKLRKLNIAQLVGYLYSGVALGYGVPKLNIYITNKVQARKAQQEKENKQIA